MTMAKWSSSRTASAAHWCTSSPRGVPPVAPLMSKGVLSRTWYPRGYSYEMRDGAEVRAGPSTGVRPAAAAPGESRSMSPTVRPVQVAWSARLGTGRVERTTHGTCSAAGGNRIPLREPRPLQPSLVVDLPPRLSLKATTHSRLAARRTCRGSSERVPAGRLRKGQPSLNSALRTPSQRVARGGGTHKCCRLEERPAPFSQRRVHQRDLSRPVTARQQRPVSSVPLL